MNLTSSEVVRLQVQAEGPGVQAWEVGGIHL